jgi:myo-inositol-1(or 4)-monophosphatase
MVSEADRASERLLRDVLRRERPDDALLGEEGASETGRSGLRWVVDPLDGTTNYLYGLPQWAVSVAVEDGAGPVASCVYDPSRDEAFTAARGAGATLAGAPLATTERADLASALIATGFAYTPELRVAQVEQLRGVIACVRDIRRAGSAALDLAWVACGRLDGFYESDLQHWDYAAGVLLVREAGGIVSIAPGPLGPPQVIATNAHLHGALSALVSRTSGAPPAAP